MAHGSNRWETLLKGPQLAESSYAAWNRWGLLRGGNKPGHMRCMAEGRDYQIPEARTHYCSMESAYRVATSRYIPLGEPPTSRVVLGVDMEMAVGSLVVALHRRVCGAEAEVARLTAEVARLSGDNAAMLAHLADRTGGAENHTAEATELLRLHETSQS